MVQSYSPGGTNVPSHVGILAPPGEYDWTCASFIPPESTTQRANQPFPPKLPLFMGDYDPHIIYDSVGQSVPTIQMASRSVQPFSHRWLHSVPILCHGPPLPLSKLPHPIEGTGPPSNTWFPRPTRVLNPNGISISSAVYAGLTSVTDRQTDRQTTLLGR